MLQIFRLHFSFGPTFPSKLGIAGAFTFAPRMTGTDRSTGPGGLDLDFGYIGYQRVLYGLAVVQPAVCAISLSNDFTCLCHGVDYRVLVLILNAVESSVDDSRMLISNRSSEKEVFAAIPLSKVGWDFLAVFNLVGLDAFRYSERTGSATMPLNKARSNFLAISSLMSFGAARYVQRTGPTTLSLSNF